MIKISVPNDDHVALRAMAKALEEIAVARGAPVQVNLVTQEMLDKWKEARGGNLICEPEVDTTSQSAAVKNWVPDDEPLKAYEELSDVHDDEQAPPTTDSTGTPWDERIHSASKALNGDGTWRLRRKPKDTDEAEWLATVQKVQDELRFPQEPVAVTPVMRDEEVKAFDDVEPTITPESDDFHVDAGVVTEQEVASFPPPPPVPVPPTFATIQEVDELLGLEPAMTFAQVMTFLTSRSGKITTEQINQVIKDMGLEKITDLNTQPEHTGPFIARVKALLGE